MSYLEKHAEKKLDNYSKGSRNKLCAAMRHKLKKTFVGCLEILEEELGLPDNKGNQALFRRLRGKILSLGNDQVRNMEIELEKYNIEFIPYQIKFLQPEQLKELGD